MEGGSLAMLMRGWFWPVCAGVQKEGEKGKWCLVEYCFAYSISYNQFWLYKTVA